MIESSFTETFPGFLSIRDEHHNIIYMNNNLRGWLKQFTDVNPIGETNEELVNLVPENVANVLSSCHDASLEFMNTGETVPKVILFRGEIDEYFNVIKYKSEVNGHIYIYTVGVCVTSLYKEARHFECESNIDELSQLYNRKYLNKESFNNEIFILIDLDGFKSVNDIHGHLSGDNVIRCFSKLLQDSFRLDDKIIRFGGDEFLVILKGSLSTESIKKKLEEIKAKFEMMFESYRFLSFSYGLSHYHDSLDETLNTIDSILYKEKNTKGRKNFSRHK